MSKLGKRLIKSAKEARTIVRCEGFEPHVLRRTVSNLVAKAMSGDANAAKEIVARLPSKG